MQAQREASEEAEEQYEAALRTALRQPLDHHAYERLTPEMRLLAHTVTKGSSGVTLENHIAAPSLQV